MRELRSSKRIDWVPSQMIFATAAVYVQAYSICAESVAHEVGAARTGRGISMARGLFGCGGFAPGSAESVRGRLDRKSVV